MKHELPILNYGYGDLEPYIDETTMSIHHSKHHAAYINNLNIALEKYPELQDKSAEELLRSLNTIPEEIFTAVKNNAGGHYNHSFFWKVIGPNKNSVPSPSLTEAINKAFGNLENFKSEFSKAAAARFGSGWAWLVLNDEGSMQIISTANQDSPISGNLTPILALDVWEHAYYLKYQNKRPEYVSAWWNVVNWDTVSELYKNAVL